MIKNESLFAPILDETITMVDCVFESGGQHYTYKTDITDLKVGDVVVAEARSWYQVVTVVSPNVPIPTKEDVQYRWIVCRVPLKMHTDVRLKAEQKMIDHMTDRRVRAQRHVMLLELGLTNADTRPMLDYIEDALDDATETQ